MDGRAAHRAVLALSLHLNTMTKLQDEFTRFEHEGWERVADKYDSVWSSLTQQFIPYLLNDAKVSASVSVLDVACGPGYVSAAAKRLGANPTGIDFSEKMIAIAKTMFPEISFIQGDAQDLPFEDSRFDCVLVNFGLPHLSHPEKACAEAHRVLKSGGRFGFTIWAGPEESPAAQIMNDAIETHATLDIGLPEGPPHYLYGEEEECRKVLGQAGFDESSMTYKTRVLEWRIPTAQYFFDAYRDAGVRITGLLARQSTQKLDAIRVAIETGIKGYAKGNQFAIPMAAHVVAVSKRTTVKPASH